MWKYFPSVREKMREKIIDVADALEEIPDGDVEIGGEILDLHAILAEGHVGLRVEKVIQAVLFAQEFNLVPLREAIHQLEHIRLGDLPDQFLADIDVVLGGLDHDGPKNAVGILICGCSQRL